MLSAPNNRQGLSCHRVDNSVLFWLEIFELGDGGLFGSQAAIFLLPYETGSKGSPFESEG